MADSKISELPIVLTAPSDAWLAIVVTDSNGVKITSRIRKSDLLK